MSSPTKTVLTEHFSLIRNRCEELRAFREALNTKEVAQAVLKQVEDKQKQREADKEMEKMWEDVGRKNYALMVMLI